MILPKLREGLSVQPANESKHLPILLVDKIKNHYYRIDAITMLIMLHWSLGDSEKIIAAVHEKEGMELTEEQIQNTLTFLTSNELIEVENKPQFLHLLKKYRKRTEFSLQYLMKHYLFLKFPVCRPDQFIQKTLPAVRIFFSKYYWYFLVVFFLFNLAALLPHSATIIGQLQNITSLQGMLLLFLALAILKAIHELGHAYVCRHQGCEVGNFGVALIVFFPILFTDTKAAWKLNNPYKRLMIDIAGIASEINVVVWCMFFWQLADSALVQQCLSYIITLGLLSSLLINGNPLMRFDGYYALSSFLRVDNLQERASNQAKWQIRHLLLGVTIPAQHFLTPIKKKIVIGFAIAAWIYRFFLYFGIAIIIYQFVFKLLGIVLFALTIYQLIAKPLCTELKFYYESIKSRPLGPRKIATLLVLCGFVLLLIFPWSTKLTVPAELIFVQQQGIYAQDNSLVSSVTDRNQPVEKGQVIITSTSPDLAFRLDAAKQTTAFLGQRIEQDARSQKSHYQEREQFDLIKANNASDNIKEQMARLDVRAPFSGITTNFSPLLSQNNWVAKNDYLFRIVNTAHWQVKAYLPEYQLERVTYIKNPYFLSDNPAQKSIELSFITRGLDSIKYLNKPYLASRYAGPIATYETASSKEHTLEVKKSLFPLFFSVASQQVVPFEQRGMVVMEVKRQSILTRVYQKLAAIIIKESSL